ncbi:hypothetical protein CPC08DRAFT_715381 [Agrocybe pediades]|nr:hypothetical protein CPC08DRAFT_715381 [Agrocybe pediades]
MFSTASTFTLWSPPSGHLLVKYRTWVYLGHGRHEEGALATVQQLPPIAFQTRTTTKTDTPFNRLLLTLSRIAFVRIPFLLDFHPVPSPLITLYHPAGIGSHCIASLELSPPACQRIPPRQYGSCTTLRVATRTWRVPFLERSSGRSVGYGRRKLRRS